MQSFTELQLAALVTILYPGQTVYKALFYEASVRGGPGACRKGKVLLRFMMPSHQARAV